MDFELSELLKLLSIIRLATYRSRNVFTDSADEAKMLARHHGFEQLNVVPGKRIECPDSTAGRRLLSCCKVIEVLHDYKNTPHSS
jgi:hypothetical protein